MVARLMLPTLRSGMVGLFLFSHVCVDYSSKNVVLQNKSEHTD